MEVPDNALHKYSLSRTILRQPAPTLPHGAQKLSCTTSSTPLISSNHAQTASSQRTAQRRSPAPLQRSGQPLATSSLDCGAERVGQALLAEGQSNVEGALGSAEQREKVLEREEWERSEAG